MYKFLKFEEKEGVATMTLNRPEVYNAFNDELTFEMQAVLKAIKEEKTARVLVITGEGKAFSSGQDLKDAAMHAGRSYSESVRTRFNPIVIAIRNLPIPVICRLNGVAAGAGCSLALSCDMIVASEEASLIEIFVNIGLILDAGSSYFLPRLMGSSKAFEIATMGKTITAQEATDLGIVAKTVPAGQLDEAVKGYTDFYKNAPTKAIGLIKKMLNMSQHASLEEVLDKEAEYQDIAGASNDHKEGITAFLEKRAPRFQGN